MATQRQRFALIEAAQEVEGFVNPLVPPLKAHATVLVGTDADEDIAKALGVQLVDGERRIAAKLELDPVGGDKVDVMLDKLGRNAELGDDVLDHATGIRFALEHGDRVTGTGQEVTGGETGRAGANDRHRMLVTAASRFVPAGLVPFPAALQRHFFQLADIERAVVVETGAVVLALVIADVAGDGRQGVALINQLKGCHILPLAHQANVLGDILMHGAGSDTGRHVAVSQRQAATHFDAILGLPLLLGVIHGEGLGGKRFQLGHVHLTHAPAVRGVDLFEALNLAQVATRLEQVGGHGDGTNTGLEDLGDVELAGTARVGDGQLAIEGAGQHGRHVDGEREQRPAGHIHLIPRQRPFAVDGAKGVGELDPEGEPLLGPQRHQAGQHRLGLIQLEVVIERLFAQTNVIKAAGIEDLAHPRVAQQGRVEFDEGVEPLLFQHVAADGLNLVGRAAVHGGEGNAVHQLSRDALHQLLQASAPRPQSQLGDKLLVGHQLAQHLLVLGKFRTLACIHQAVDELLHRWLFDAIEVVTHAHVEDKGLGLSVETRVEHLFQQVEGKPGFQILVKRLGQGELGRPLGVEALVFGIDAGLFQFETVQDLHRLELDKAPASQPGGDDVLGQLGMGAGCRADGGLAGFTEHLDLALVLLAIKLCGGNTENSLTLFIFRKNTGQKVLEGNGSHNIAHGYLLAAVLRIGSMNKWGIPHGHYPLARRGATIRPLHRQNYFLG